MSADRNLLFGILALQLDLITRDQLVAAMGAWVLAKHRSLGELLVEQKALGIGWRHLLDGLVAEHLKQHDDNAQKSLAVVSSIQTVREALDKLQDEDVHASLAHVSTETSDPDRTLDGAVDAGKLAGQRFRILRPHAKGGLGEVHVARDLELQREVALKEIQERYAHRAESRARFVLEAEITGGLEHPGIVPVYGLGTYGDGRPFYAMRFIRGDSLKEGIARFHGTDGSKGSGDAPSARGRASAKRGSVGLEGERLVKFRQLLGRFTDVCQAIAYAHSRGVLHRDLKPGNIMLGKFGETLVVDWGLAKTMHSCEPGVSSALQESIEAPLRPSSSGSAETIVGSAIGTPPYMSPEQAAGRLDLLGPASDVYSLGATLYHLLTGQPAFIDQDVETVLAKVSRGEFLGPRQVKSDVPAGLEAICLKAMALRREDRYATPTQLADDVEHWLADEPVGAWREPMYVRARRWFRRHRTLAMSAAAILVGATAASIDGNITLSRTTTELEQATLKVAEANNKTRDANAGLRSAMEESKIAFEKLAMSEKKARELAAKEFLAREEAERERKLKEGQLARSERLLYHATFRDAVHHWENDDLITARESLHNCRPDLRGPEYGYLTRQVEARARPLLRHLDSVESIALSVDGKRVFSGSQDTTIKVWDLLLGKEALCLTGHTGPVASLVLTRDGKRLISGSGDTTIRIWDLGAGKEVASLRGHTEGVTSVALSSDGKRLYSGSWDTTIKVWDLESGMESSSLRGHTEGVTSVALSSDGKRLYSGSWDKTIKIWDLEAGKEASSLRGHTAAVASLALSPDGKHLFSGSNDTTIIMWNLETGKETSRLRGHADTVKALALSPNGKRLFSASGDATIRVWDLEVGKTSRRWRGHNQAVRSLALSSDGAQLFSGGWDKMIKVWDLEADETVLRLSGHADPVVSLALSSDGKKLFSGSWDKTIKVWDLELGKEVRSLRGHKDGVSSLALSPHQERLFSGSGDATIREWNLATGKATRGLRGHAAPIMCLTLSSDGRRLFSGSDDKTIKVWDLDAGKEMSTLRGHTDGVTTVTLSSDGKWLISGSSDTTIKAWLLHSGKESFELRGHKDGVISLALSADGKQLFSGSLDGTIKVWDLDARKDSLTLRGHKDGVSSLALTSDGTRLFSGSWDGAIKLWDLEAEKEIFSLRGHSKAVASLVLSFDGKRLFSGSGDATIKVWDISAYAPSKTERPKGD